MKYLYCPIPWNKLTEIGISFKLKPFSWDDSKNPQEALPWTGSPALVFYSNIPQLFQSQKSVGRIQASAIIKIREDLIFEACDISNDLGLEVGSVFAQFHSIDLIPGRFWALVDGSEVMLAETVFQLSGAGIQAKFTENTSQQIVIPLHDNSTEYPKWINQTPSVEDDFERLRERLVAFKLSMFLARQKKGGTSGWHEVLAFLFRMRKIIGSHRTDKALEVAARPVDDLRYILRDMTSLLTRLTGAESAQLVHDWVSKQVQKNHRSYCSDAVCNTVDFILNEGGPVVRDILLEKSLLEIVNDIREEHRPKDIWYLYAKYRKSPYRLDTLNQFGQAVQERVFSQSVNSLRQAVASTNLSAHVYDDAPAELSHNEQIIFRHISRGILLFKLAVKTTEWKTKGFDEGARRDLVNTIIEELVPMQSSISRELNSVQQYLNDSSQLLLFEVPQLSPVVLNFLIFLMHPLDDKRLREQQKAWKCSQPEIGIAFQSGFVGIASSPGSEYHSLFEAIQNDENLQDTVLSWVKQCEKDARILWEQYLNKEIDEKQVDSLFVIPQNDNTTTMLYNQQSDRGSDDDVLGILQKKTTGFTRSQIVNQLGVDDKNVGKMLARLKKKSKIICEKNGMTSLWKLNDLVTGEKRGE